MKQVAVLIIGAGPVGLVAGLRLARAGIETLVLDKAGSVNDDFRASTFHPPTLEMLDELGLTQDLIAQGLVSPTWQIRQHESHNKAQFDLSVLGDDTRYPFRLQCEQRALTRLADAKAQSTANLKLHYGVELTGLAQDASSVSATVSTPTGTETISASYLIAADGARSICRKLTGMTFTGETYPETTILALRRTASRTSCPAFPTSITCGASKAPSHCCDCPISGGARSTLTQTNRSNRRWSPRRSSASC